MLNTTEVFYLWTNIQFAVKIGGKRKNEIKSRIKLV